ncbi:hypothetical protein BRD04_01625 [Halobacteriales archaeon QS_9_67_17]|nr:MAG: hypothetical protein BRD04_01625 [Halobacteriales archaeon QS_9_67_17]
MSGPLRTLRALLAARRRSLAVIGLALLVVSSVAAVPVIAERPSPGRVATVENPGPAAASAPVVQVENTSAYLDPPADSIQTEEFAVVELDPAAATGVRTARLHGRYTNIRLRETFTAADTDAERRAVVRNTTRRLDGRLDELERRQADALAAYNRGDLSKTAFLRELVAIHAAANAMETTVDQLYTFDRAAGMPISQSSIARLKARLVPLQGPVRARLAASVTSGQTDRVYVMASETGVVLATLVEGEFTTRYVREAFYGGAFDDQFSDRPIEIGAFRDRVAELYPWTWTNGNADTVLTSEPFYQRAGVYGIAFKHPHGTVGDSDLVAFYDAGTGEVFYETQRKDVEATPHPLVASTTGDGIRLELRGTHPGGPLDIRVVNATDGTPVDARVTLNGDRIGRTGNESLWTLAPRDSFVVTASTPDGNVTATTSI